MTQSAQEKNELMRAKRDEKVRDHLSQYAPVWLIGDEMIPQEDAISFTVLFAHPSYGWVRRRYRFDSYNNVLYYKGQVTVNEDDIFELTEAEPYLAAPSINTVNSYGG